MARNYQVSVRKTNGLEIWFVNPRDIYIKDMAGRNLQDGMSGRETFGLITGDHSCEHCEITAI